MPDKAVQSIFFIEGQIHYDAPTSDENIKMSVGEKAAPPVTRTGTVPAVPYHFCTIVSGGGMNCVSCDICVYHLRFVCAFALGYSSAPE